MSWSEQTQEEYEELLRQDDVATSDTMVRRGETYTTRDQNLEPVNNAAHHMGTHLFGSESPTNYPA